jgi:SAM-dependent methyltransferase
MMENCPMNEATRLREAYAPLKPFEERMAKPGFRRLYAERDARLIELLPTLPKPLWNCRILDVGCGSGRFMTWLVQQGATPELVTGVEVQPDRVASARRANPDLLVLQVSATNLPFLPATFDIVVAFTMFSSVVDPAIARRIAREISRVLAPGGIVLWYDMRYPNPANRHLRAMTQTRIRELFPLLGVELEPITLLPPLAQRLGSLTEALYSRLAAVTPLRSHYLGMLRDRHATIVNPGVV